MSFEDDCFFREEQIWNKIYDNAHKTIRVETRNKVRAIIKRIEIAAKDVETPFELPKGVYEFSIRDTGNSRMRYSYTAGEIAKPLGDFIELGPYGIYKESQLNSLDEFTLYFSSTKNARIIELIYWI